MEVLHTSNSTFFLEIRANESSAFIVFDERSSDALDVVSPGGHLFIVFYPVGGPGVEFLFKITITKETGKAY